MLGGTLLLTIVCTLPLHASMMAIGMLITIFITLLGSGIALPNCLSLALVDFQDVIGTGAIFSLGYYLLVSAITSGMSLLHNGSLLTMPLYFLGLTLIMWLCGRKFIR